jgi:hypothetical protein
MAKRKGWAAESDPGAGVRDLCVGLRGHLKLRTSILSHIDRHCDASANRDAEPSPTAAATYTPAATSTPPATDTTIGMLIWTLFGPIFSCDQKRSIGHRHSTQRNGP